MAPTKWPQSACMSACLLACLPALEPPGLFRMLLELIIWGKSWMDICTHDILTPWAPIGAKNCHDTWRTHLWSCLAPCISSPGRTSRQLDRSLHWTPSPGVTPSHLWRPPPVSRYYLNLYFRLQPHVEKNGNWNGNRVMYFTVFIVHLAWAKMHTIPKQIKYYVISMCNSISTWLAWVN